VPNHAITSLATVKLLLAPALIGIASLVARYGGPALGGWITALPLTSGPVALLLALEHGPAFAAQACLGILLALPSLAAFALVYAWTAPHMGWPSSTALGCAAYLICTAVSARELSAAISITAGFVAACCTVVLALFAMPRGLAKPTRATASGREILLRMMLALVLVWILTRSAGLLGARASGLLTPFPVAASLLAAFTHRAEGHAAAAHLLRGLLSGLFSFAVFFLVAGATLLRWGTARAFSAAIVAALVVHAVHALLWYAMRLRTVGADCEPLGDVAAAEESR
jgi:hypothetical protein